MKPFVDFLGYREMSPLNHTESNFDPFGVILSFILSHIILPNKMKKAWRRDDQSITPPLSSSLLLWTDLAGLKAFLALTFSPPLWMNDNLSAVMKRCWPPARKRAQKWAELHFVCSDTCRQTDGRTSVWTIRGTAQIKTGHPRVLSRATWPSAVMNTAS